MLSWLFPTKEPAYTRTDKLEDALVYSDHALNQIGLFTVRSSDALLGTTVYEGLLYRLTREENHFEILEERRFVPETALRPRKTGDEWMLAAADAYHRSKNDNVARARQTAETYKFEEGEIKN